MRRCSACSSRDGRNACARCATSSATAQSATAFRCPPGTGKALQRHRWLRNYYEPVVAVAGDDVRLAPRHRARVDRPPELVDLVFTWAALMSDKNRRAIWL